MLKHTHINIFLRATFDDKQLKSTIKFVLFVDYNKNTKKKTKVQEILSI